VGLCVSRYGGLLLLAFGLSAATGSDLRFAASFALFYVLDRKAGCPTECTHVLSCRLLASQSISNVHMRRIMFVGSCQVELEESALAKKYREYGEYKETAKRFIPYLY
jgi:protein-S-isoprenylcysteine O-methyltransferase Ste14